MNRAFWSAIRHGRRAAKGKNVPVYEALFADGAFTRKSFWSDSRLPVDPAQGRPDPVRYMLEDVVHHRRSIAPPPVPVRLLAGWVEYNGGRWRDPAAGDPAINDGAPIIPDGGVPETPSAAARQALKERRGHEKWLALMRQVKDSAPKGLGKRRARTKEAA